MTTDGLISNDSRWMELADVRAVEFGGALAGRLLSKLLFDQGAVVTSLDAGSGPGPAIGPVDEWPSVPADPATPAGVDAIRAALETADIFVDSSPEGIGTIGLDPAALLDEHPGLLFCEITGLPEEAGRRIAPEEWMAAAELGFHRMSPDGPEIEPLPILSSYAAIHGALSIAAALGVSREDRPSRMIRVSLLGSGIMGLNMRFERLADTSLVESSGRFRLPIADRYLCADGRSLQINGTVPSVARAVFEAIGHPEWTEDGIAAITRVESYEAQETWRQRFADSFITKGAWEWEDLFAEKGAAGTVCRTRKEWIEEPQAYATAILERPSDHKVSEPRVGAALRLFAVPTKTPAPATASPVPGALPLAGKRVLDLSIIFAGPTAGRLLGELGADVIKIDPPYRSAPPYVGTTPWMDVDRAKRSVLIDLRTEKGKEAMWKLIDTTDVLLENLRVGKLERLGFGTEAVFERRPKLVYVSLNAFDFGGPMSPRPGWEPNAQALAGMQAVRGKGGVPPRVPIPVNDFGTGAIGALGAVLALRAVDRTGVAQHVRASLTRTASFIQTTELTHELLGGSSDPRPAWLDRDLTVVETSDGWLTVEQLPAGDELLDRLGKDKKSLSTDAALAAFGARGVRAAPARVPEDLLELEWLESSGLIGWWENRNWGSVRNDFARPKVTPPIARNGWAAPDPGDDTVAVLGELGYSDGEIESMLATGACAGRNPLFESSQS